MQIPSSFRCDLSNDMAVASEFGFKMPSCSGFGASESVKTWTMNNIEHPHADDVVDDARGTLAQDDQSPFYEDALNGFFPTCSVNMMPFAPSSTSYLSPTRQTASIENLTSFPQKQKGGFFGDVGASAEQPQKQRQRRRRRRMAKTMETAEVASNSKIGNNPGRKESVEVWPAWQTGMSSINPDKMTKDESALLETQRSILEGLFRSMGKQSGTNACGDVPAMSGEQKGKSSSARGGGVGRNNKRRRTAFEADADDFHLMLEDFSDIRIHLVEGGYHEIVLPNKKNRVASEV